MTARALRVEAEPRWGSRIEARVELRHGGVAGQAELRDALVREQVAVRRAMRRMAGSTAFGARRGVLEDERAALVGVAVRALFLLEAAEQRPRRGRVRVVARRAFERTFAKPMMLVQRELRERCTVTIEAKAARCAERRQLLRHVR